MPTLKQIIRESIQRLGPTLGRTVPITSLTTTTAVAAQLAVGGLGGERYRGYWMFRQDTASAADLSRRCSLFTASSGTLTHAGTNYADTTATDEKLDILVGDLEPYMFVNAAQEIVPQLKRLDVTEVPAYGGERYNLKDFDWIKSDSDIYQVTYRPTPQLSRNRSFERWNTYNTSGILQPDHWVLSGTAATMARSTTGVRRGAYSVAVTAASGNDATLTQTVGLLDNGAATIAGTTITVVGKFTAGSASMVRLFCSDGITTTNSSYHTGAGGYEELSVEKTIASTATTLTFGFTVEVDGTAQADECYLVVGSLNDGVRINAFQEQKVNPYWLKDGGSLTAQLDPKAIGSGQYLFYAIRGYPAFDADRKDALSAVADTTDAPLLPAALGVAGLMFRQLAGRREDENNDRFARLGEEYTAQFNVAAMDHYTKNLPADGGIVMPKRQFSIPARRFGGRR